MATKSMRKIPTSGKTSDSAVSAEGSDEKQNVLESSEYVNSMDEKTLMQAIIDAARSLGFLTYHTWNSQRSAAGFPDLILVGKHYGSVLYVECKSDRGPLRPAQEEWIEALRDIGELAYVIRPKDYDAFLDVLQEWAW